MIDGAQLRKAGVALLASRISILGDDPCGGSEVVLWEDAHILESAGIPVRVYARAARSGAPVKILSFRSRTAQLNTIEYARALLRNEPEAPILAYNEPALAGCAPDRSIVRFDWTTPLPRYWSWPLWLSRFARSRYLFPSESERENFLELLARIPSMQAFVVPNAVDLALFQPAKQAPPRGSNGSLRVGFAGQWIGGERHPRAAGCMDRGEIVVSSRSASSGRRACALEARHGSAGDARGECACVREMEQQGLVHSVGTIPRSQMPQFWNSVDIAIVPSLSETFGLVALEALACGVPVIAAAAGGLKEIVADGVCGLLVAPGDSAALSRALHELISNESLRLRLAAGARLRAQEFSMQRRSRELLGLLLERTYKAA